MGWAGNVFLVAGLVLIGRKWRHAFGLTFVGEVLWLVESARIERLDMVVLCLVFAAIAAWNWFQWTRGEDR